MPIEFAIPVAGGSLVGWESGRGVPRLVLHGGPLSGCTEPIGDIDGNTEYTRTMIRVFVRRALRQALTAAPAG